MKEKIFQQLKLKYSSLGLGDEILMGHAESLAGLGLVTDENLDAVTNAQKAFLEGLQKSNDKRVTDAVNTAREKARKEFEEASEKARKEAEEKAKADEKAKAEKDAADKAEAERLEAIKKQGEEEFRTKLDAENKAYRESIAKQIKELGELAKSQKDAIDGLISENNALKAAKAREERLAMITAKAKELNIPQYRIDEGFNIADDADESAISTYLSTVANNIKVNNLPAPNRTTLSDGQVTASEIEDILKGM